MSQKRRKQIKRKQHKRMEATKVRVQPQTLNNSFLSRKTKRRLREARVIEHIKSKPAGTPIVLEEFRSLLSHKNISSTALFMTQMVTKGTLSRYKDGKGNAKTPYVWSVNDATSHFLEEKEADEPAPSNKPEVRISFGNADTEGIIALAKDYFWDTQDDSLKSFIKWLEESNA